MYPSGKVYQEIIIPKIRKRCNNKCEVCGREDFLWITPIWDMENWDNLEVLDVEAPPVGEASVKAICWRCAPHYLGVFSRYLISKQKTQLKLEFINYAELEKKIEI